MELMFNARNVKDFVIRAKHLLISAHHVLILSIEQEVNVNALMAGIAMESQIIVYHAKKTVNRVQDPKHAIYALLIQIEY